MGYLNIDEYCKFLKQIKKTVGDEKIALFFDGLNIHKSAKANNLIAKYRWVKILNEAWQSNNNPIENYIGFIKRHYYKQKLRIGCNQNIVNGKNLNEIMKTDPSYRNGEYTKVFERKCNVEMMIIDPAIVQMVN